MNSIIKLSVHNLVDPILRTGDIDNRIFNKETMLEGSRIHSKYQKKQGSTYLSEFPLSCSIEYGEFIFIIEGRADGIIISKNQTTVEEIKSCNENLDAFFEKNGLWHLGQAKVYAYMYAKKNNLSNIFVRLTYISQNDNNNLQYKDFSFEFDDLESFVLDLIGRYTDFYSAVSSNRRRRNESIKKIEFPYNNVRKYQQEYMDAVTDSIIEKGKILIEAPTGIGKTISTLYPHIKNFGPDLNKIFFLTAKTIGRNTAQETIEVLNTSGLFAKCVVLTGKDKMCPLNEPMCNPDKCPFAREYYNKIREILIKELHSGTLLYTEEIIKEIAFKNNICPFELSLDLSNFSDIVICDYNYVFDPFSYLQRLREDSSNDYSLLIDEGHNLIKRARDMYSSKITYQDMKAAMKSSAKKKSTKMFTGLKKMFKTIFEEYGPGEHIVESFDKKIINALTNFVSKFKDNDDEEDRENMSRDFRNFFYAASNFVKLYHISEMSDLFKYYFSIENEKSMSISIYCVCPSPFINEITSYFRNTVLFSGTFSPMTYYKNAIFGKSNVKVLQFDYPFDRNKFGIVINPYISLKYKDRSISIESVCKTIKTFINARVGNYIIYVPSFQYMELLKDNKEFSGFHFEYQQRNMNATDKIDFLNNLDEFSNVTNVLVAVLGGTFAESINLEGDKLIGVVILGVGFPAISIENNSIKDYYDKNENGSGMAYAYTYPGMNNVAQAVGRLIRSPQDCGVALLIDTRYSYKNYISLFKKERMHYTVVNDDLKLNKYLSLFYKKNEKL
ncbi:MAG: ATP-dependent DNA helicase [Bacilli bacterium]